MSRDKIEFEVGDDKMPSNHDTVYYDGTLGTYVLVKELLRKMPDVYTKALEDGPTFTIYRDKGDIGTEVPVDSRVHLRENGDIEIRNKNWDTPLVIHHITDLEPRVGADGYSVSELMDMGEAILKEAHTKDIAEREERILRDDIIDEADKSFDEDVAKELFKEFGERPIGGVSMNNAPRDDVFGITLGISEDGVGMDCSVDDLRIALAKNLGMFKDGVDPIDKLIIENVVGVVLGEESALDGLRNVYVGWNECIKGANPTMEPNGDICDDPMARYEDECAEAVPPTIVPYAIHQEIVNSAYADGLKEGRAEDGGKKHSVYIERVENYHA